VIRHPGIGSLHDLVKVKNMILDEEACFRVARNVAIALSFLNKRRSPHGNLRLSSVYVGITLIKHRYSKTGLSRSETQANTNSTRPS